MAQRRARWPWPWLGVLSLSSVLAAEPEAAKPMNFKIKKLTEEEAMSEVMPPQFQCLACKAVTYQINKHLEELQPKDPKVLEKSVLRQQAIRLTESLEEACHLDTYKDYGVKDLSGDSGKVLIGPGIENEQAGVIQGGGKWPRRLSSICKRIVEEEEDEAALAASWRKGNLQRKCDEDCGKAAKTAKSAAPKKSKSKKTKSKGSSPAPAQRTGLEELPQPPYEHKVVTAENISLIFNPPIFQKFALVLFFDTLPRSAHALACWEYGARILGDPRKEKLQDLRRTVLARYNSSSGDTWGYNFQGPLPRALLYRKGYKNPKKYDGPLEGPDDLIDWMKEEVANYMKDDPQRFPRSEL